MCLSEQPRLEKKLERNSQFEWGKGLISVLFPDTAFLCMEQQFVKSSKPMKNATSLLFEERMIVTSSESENDICYFENRNACALAAYFKSKAVLLTEGLTYSEELLQEYTWSVCACIGTVLSLPGGDSLSKDV